MGDGKGDGNCGSAMKREQLYLDGKPTTYEHIQCLMNCSNVTITDRIKTYGRSLTTEMFKRKPRTKEYDYSAFEYEEVSYRPPEKKGRGEFDAYQLKPIVLPETLTEEDMRPFRKLANSVLTQAFADIVPTRPRNQSSRKTEQAKVQLAISDAYRFLSGESGTDRLSLWCSLSGQPMWKIKARVNDREKIVKHMRTLLKGTGRGGKSKSRLVEVVA